MCSTTSHIIFSGPTDKKKVVKRAESKGVPIISPAWYALIHSMNPELITSNKVKKVYNRCGMLSSRAKLDVTKMEQRHPSMSSRLQVLLRSISQLLRTVRLKPKAKTSLTKWMRMMKQMTAKRPRRLKRRLKKKTVFQSPCITKMTAT